MITDEDRERVCNLIDVISGEVELASTDPDPGGTYRYLAEMIIDERNDELRDVLVYIAGKISPDLFGELQARFHRRV